MIQFLFSLFLFSSLFSEIHFFLPPDKWQCAHLQNVSPHLEVGFIAPFETAGFHPSLNLAKEEIDVDLKAYLKAVKEVHLAQPETTWRDLGRFKMKAGEGRLTEIQQNLPNWGAVKILQSIFIKDKTAFILTAAMLKDDFSRLQKEVLEAMRSFDVAPSLFAPIQDPQQKEKVETLFTSLSPERPQEEQWERLQKELAPLEPLLGSHWLFLALKEGRAKIYP